MRFVVLLLALLVPFSALAEGNLTDDGMIRVKLSSLGERSELNFTLHGEYRLGGLRFRSGAEIALCIAGGKLRLSAGDVTAELGGEAVLERLDPDGGLEIAESGRSNLYCGDLTVKADGGLSAVLRIDIEDYLPGVVAYEMSDSFPIEALKAQAVAARTYAMRRKSDSADRDYDLTDTTADQVFRGLDARYENVIAAVRATEGMVGTADGRFAACYYTASNGGWISMPGDVWSGEDQGHIRRKADPYDLENPRSLVSDYWFPEDLSGCAVLKEMLVRAANKNVMSVLDVQPAEPLADGGGQYARLKFTVLTEDGEITDVSLSVYDEIKPGLGLGLNRSDWERVSVERTDGGFSIAMRGFGHGVGMSQRGAQQMAGVYGKKWRGILAFYYPGMAVRKLERPEKTAWVCVDSVLNLREEPSEDARILARLPNGETVLAGEASDGWVKVRTADGTGYVRQEYILMK